MGYPPQPPPGYGPPGYGPPGDGYGQQPARPSNVPMILSIIGIICWFCCAPLSIVLGIVAQTQFRRQGQPDTLAKVAWIGGVVALALGLVFTIMRFSTGGRSGY
jgi:hypothetical protein